MNTREPIQDLVIPSWLVLLTHKRHIMYVYQGVLRYVCPFLFSAFYFNTYSLSQTCWEDYGYFKYYTDLSDESCPEQMRYQNYEDSSSTYECLNTSASLFISQMVLWPFYEMLRAAVLMSFYGFILVCYCLVKIS